MALVDLAFFSAIFLLVVTGFAMSFYMAFGLHVGGYASVADALLSLFQVRARVGARARVREYGLLLLLLLLPHLTGQVTIDECSATIKSIELQVTCDITLTLTLAPQPPP